RGGRTAVSVVDGAVSCKDAFTPAARIHWASSCLAFDRCPADRPLRKFSQLHAERVPATLPTVHRCSTAHLLPTARRGLGNRSPRQTETTPRIGSLTHRPRPIRQPLCDLLPSKLFYGRSGRGGRARSFPPPTSLRK